MKKQDRMRWIEKTKKLNEHEIISINDEVTDPYNRKGIVTHIRLPEDDDDHGTITVRLDDNEEEHYCYNNWKTVLRKK